MLRVARAVGMPLLVRRSSAPLVAGPRRSTLCASLAGIRHYRAPRRLLAASPSPNINSAAPSSPPPTPSEKQQTPEEATPSEQSAASQLAPPATGSSDTAADAAPQSSQTQTVAEAIARPESAMRRLFASWQQGVVASIGAVMGIGFLLYFLYTPVKEDTVHHTAVVASEALGDARLKGQAVQLSKDVVLEVLRDPKSLDAAVDVVVGLLAREETKIAVSSLLQSLFEDHYTQEVTKKFVLQVVQDPWIQDQLQGITEEQVRKLLRNPEIKKSLSDFLLSSAVDSLEKPQFHYEVARAIRQSAASVFNFWWK